MTAHLSASFLKSGAIARGQVWRQPSRAATADFAFEEKAMRARLRSARNDNYDNKLGFYVARSLCAETVLRTSPALRVFAPAKLYVSDQCAAVCVARESEIARRIRTDYFYGG